MTKKSIAYIVAGIISILASPLMWKLLATYLVIGIGLLLIGIGITYMKGVAEKCSVTEKE